jgi:excisionase family DNA binding protein
MERTLTINQVAENLKVKPRTVRSWISKKKIPAIVLPGGDIRLRVSSVEAWMKDRTIKAN